MIMQTRDELLAAFRAAHTPPGGAADANLEAVERLLGGSPPPGGGGTGPAIKLAIVASVAVAAAVVAMALVPSGPEPKPIAASAPANLPEAPEPVAPAPPAVPPAAQTPASAESVRESPVDEPKPAGTKSEKRPGPSKPAADPAAKAPSIEDEIALIARIKADLAVGKTGRAMAGIAEHESTFRTGRLVDERKLLHMQTLCKSGKPDQARRERDVFLRRKPNAAISTRVRETCTE